MVPQQSWTEDSIRQLREQQDLPFVRADASGVVREINQRFREVYGWSDDQLLGQSLGLILPPSFRDSHPLRVCTLQAHRGISGVEPSIEIGNLLCRRNGYRE